MDELLFDFFHEINGKKYIYFIKWDPRKMKIIFLDKVSFVGELRNFLVQNFELKKQDIFTFMYQVVNLSSEEIHTV